MDIKILKDRFQVTIERGNLCNRQDQIIHKRIMVDLGLLKSGKVELRRTIDRYISGNELVSKSSVLRSPTDCYLICVDADKLVDPAHKKIRSRLCAREYKTKGQGKIQRAPLASHLFSAMPPLEAVKPRQLVYHERHYQASWC